MNCHGSGIVQHYKKSLTMISEFHCLQLPVLDFSRLNCPFMAKNPAAFRSSLPDSFLFWTFLGLIVHLWPKIQLLSGVHCLTASYFGLFPTWLSIYVQKSSCLQEFTAWSLPVLDFSQINCSFMSKNPVTFKRSQSDSFLFWTFPGLIVHLCPKIQLLSGVHCLTASCFGLFQA